MMNNRAISGGAVHFSHSSSALSNGNASVTFIGNYATENGGALNLVDYFQC